MYKMIMFILGLFEIYKNKKTKMKLIYVGPAFDKIRQHENPQRRNLFKFSNGKISIFVVVVDFREEFTLPFKVKELG